jgi:hypothetical protein
VGAKEQSGRTWPSIFWARGTVLLQLLINRVFFVGGDIIFHLPAWKYFCLTLQAFKNFIFS